MDDPDWMVTEFTTLFSRLKGIAQGNPAALKRMAQNQPGLGKQCRRLTEVADRIHLATVSEPQLFVEGVNAGFIAQWNAYRSGWAQAFLAAAGLDGFVGHAWDSDELNARMTALNIEEGWEAALFLASNQSEYPEAAEAVQMGARAWDAVQSDLSIEPERWLIRRASLRAVHVPKQGAGQIDGSDPYSLYASLHEAQQAYVYGLTLACLALIRATVERTLVLMYAAPTRQQGAAPGAGKLNHTTLGQKINEVADRLPSDANAEKLHRIQHNGNGAVHIWASDRHPLPDPTSVLSEHLETLRVLIEQAPPNVPRR